MNKIIFILLIFIVFSKGIAAAEGSFNDLTKLQPECFKMVVSNPILSKDALFRGATWNDPHVIKVRSQFVMYASSDKNFDQDIKIYRLVSDDGIHWAIFPKQPVLSRSNMRGAWDRKAVETPAVVFFKGLYYLFYTAYPLSQTDAVSYRIMYATSSDGITWSRQKTFFGPTAPNSVVPTLDFRQWIVAEPAPVVFKDKIFLYFTALGADPSVGATLQTIGLVTSEDGKKWSVPQKVLNPDQVQYCRKSNWKGYSAPNAVILNDQVHLFFNVVTDVPFEGVKIHHAYSINGISGWVQDKGAIFDRVNFSPWGDVNLSSPAVLLHGKKLMLWFSGNGSIAHFPDVKMGIGMATCDL